MPYKQQQAVVRVSLSTKAEIDKLTAATGLSIPKLLHMAIETLARIDEPNQQKCEGCKQRMDVQFMFCDSEGVWICQLCLTDNKRAIQ